MQATEYTYDPESRSGQVLLDDGTPVPFDTAAFDAGGVHLVAVPIDYSENKRVLVDELRDRQKSVTGR